MADIGATLLTNGTDTDDLSVYTTGSHTPTANALVLCVIVGNDSGENALSNPTGVTGNGLTWVEVITADYNSNSTPRNNITVFRAMGSSPSTGTTEITFDDTQSQAKWLIIEFDNVRTSGANGADAIVQSVKNSADSATTITATLAAFEHANNATFGAFANHGTGPTWTQGTGFTLIAQTTGDLNALAQFRADNHVGVDASHDASAGDIAGIGIEIRNAIGAITATVLASSTDATNTTGFTTASQTPSPNTLILAFIGSTNLDTSEPPAPTLVGNNLTWVELADVTYGGNTRNGFYCFRAMGSSPSAGTNVITFSQSQTNVAWTFVEFGGVDTGGSNGADAVVQIVEEEASAGTSISVTMAAFGATDNASVGGFNHETVEVFTEGSGFTELADHGGTIRTGNMTEFKNSNDTGIDATYATSIISVGVGLELKAASDATTQAAGTSGHLGIMLGW